MSTQIPISKIVAANFVGGFVGAYVYGFLNTYSLTYSLLYGIIGAISLSLSEASIYYLSNKVYKSLTFGIVAGVSVSCLGYLLLSPDESFLHFSVPIFIGCLFGGTLYIYLNTNWRTQN